MKIATIIILSALSLTACKGTIPTTSPANHIKPISEVGTSLQEEMLNAVNHARATERNCGKKHFPAAKPLKLDAALTKAAQSHSEDMAKNNFFSHTGKTKAPQAIEF